MTQNVPGLPPPKPKRGEVYWVRIPREQAEGSEHRDTEEGNPHAYVIVSRDSVNDRATTVIGVPFTSRLQKANKTYRPLIRGRELPGDLDDAVVMCDHIREIGVQRFCGRIGSVTLFAMGIIDNAIAFLLDGS
jgi:mRNA-degrading endonuclease toxin of MazEF toxin-antitoxin module